MSLKIFEIIVYSAVMAFLLAVLGTVGFLTYTNYYQGPHPSDETLMANFASNKVMFSKLVTMLESDIRLRNKYRTVTTRDFNITDREEGPYHDILAKLEITNAYGNNFKNIRFLVHRKGRGLAGSTKGYQYLEGKPEDLSENLDQLEESHGSSGLRHLEGNWYIYYSINFKSGS